MRKITLLLSSLLFLVTAFTQDNTCSVENKSFQAGEKIRYRISYNWFVVFAEVGDVTFTVEDAEIDGKKALHFTGDGRSNSWWDTFFEVRDKYEVYVNPENLRPYYFERNIKEGNFTQFVNYNIHESDTLAFCKYRVKEGDWEYDTIGINSCTYDIMSTLLFARNIDYSNIKKGQKIPVTVLLDRKLYNLYFRYQGNEIVTIKKVGEFECMKFSVMVIEGNMFHEGENLQIWVTKDKNHMPVFIESPIQVGNVKVRLQSWEGLRYPLESKIK